MQLARTKALMSSELKLVMDTIPAGASTHPYVEVCSCVSRTTISCIANKVRFRYSGRESGTKMIDPIAKIMVDPFMK